MSCPYLVTVSRLEIGEGDLVTDRYVVTHCELEIGIIFGDDTQHVGAGLEILDHDDADIVLAIVHEQLWNAHSSDSLGSLADCKSYIRY